MKPLVKANAYKKKKSYKHSQINSGPGNDPLYRLQTDGMPLKRGLKFEDWNFFHKFRNNLR